MTQLYNMRHNSKNLTKVFGVVLALFATATMLLCGCEDDHYYGNWKILTNVNEKGLADAASFVIGNNAYMVGGYGYYRTYVYFNKTWRYNSENRAWTEMDSLPGKGRSQGVAFVFGNKAYFGTGIALNGEFFDEFFEFNPSQPKGSQWKKINDPIPCGPCYGAMSFVINGIGYVCGGYTEQKGMSREIYKFDPSKPEGSRWSLIETAKLVKRMEGNVMVIDNKAYIIGGRSNKSKVPEFECFDPATETVRMVSENIADDYTENLLRHEASSFVIDGNGYVCCGLKFSGEVLRDMWRFTPNNGKGVWQKMCDFIGPSRSGASSFEINGIGYVACGQNGVGGYNFYDEIWQFDPNERWSRRIYK